MKLVVVFGFCMFLLGPNLLWLNWSTVRIEKRGQQSTNCTIYVEGELYHVRTWFTSSTTGDCTYGGSPPLTPLLLAELL